MYAKLIKRILSKVMTGEIQSSFALTGKQAKAEAGIVIKNQENKLPAEKARHLLNQMSLNEKIAMLGGQDNLAIKGLPRLQMPTVWCSDASAGVRCFGEATAFPAPIAMAATWNIRLVGDVASAIAEECRSKGVSVLLGPGVNIYRVPTNGRNFEYFGEDPFLAARLAVSYVKSVQKRGVIATIKHFACNNSEYDRHRMDSRVDERSLHEIYFPAFKAAIQEGNCQSVMCAYNPVNGVYASENHYLLTQVLRDQWGFQGFVMSDWNCLYSTEGPIKAGLDLEMPYGKYLNQEKILPLFERGVINQADIDIKIQNILTAFFSLGIPERPTIDNDAQGYCSAHRQIAQRAAEEGIVLLKNNNNVLPWRIKEMSSIVVIGPNALKTPSCGGGSCYVQTNHTTSIVDALRERLPKHLELVHIKDKRYLRRSDKKLIAAADGLIYCGGFNQIDESECFERSWRLPRTQRQAIRRLSQLNDKLVVIVNAGGGFETKSWLDDISALVHAFYLGECSGDAIAEILLGKVNPSGKLPFTMAKNWEDIGATKNYVKKPEKISWLRIAGPQGKKGWRRIYPVTYREGIMVGYRHFDYKEIQPQFAFGFGLSYTKFSLDQMSLSATSLGRDQTVIASAILTNTGLVAGSEVVQLYISALQSKILRPQKELKGFQKVDLEPGQSMLLEFVIFYEDLYYYDSQIKQWQAEAGLYEVSLGFSSRDIAFSERFLMDDA